MSKAFDRVADVLAGEDLNRAVTTKELADLASVSVPTAKKHGLALVEMGVAKYLRDGVTFRHNPWNYDPAMRRGCYSRTPTCDLWVPVNNSYGL